MPAQEKVPLTRDFFWFFEERREPIYPVDEELVF